MKEKIEKRKQSNAINPSLLRVCYLFNQVN